MSFKARTVLREGLDFVKATAHCAACEEQCFETDHTEIMIFVEDHFPHNIHDVESCANPKGQPWACEGDLCAACGGCAIHCQC